MSAPSNRTVSARPQDAARGWVVVDAEDQVLGRLATRIATVLRGKHRPDFTPHVDTGDFVVVVNARKVKLTGNKLDDKRYYHYTGYFGGLRSSTARELMTGDERDTERIIRQAVKGMLPKNRLGRAQLKKLKIYVGAEHPHAAQKPASFPANV